VLAKCLLLSALHSFVQGLHGLNRLHLHIMNTTHIEIIASELTESGLSVRPKQVEATLALLDQGATVPFISRYRKEVTGSLDEVAVTAIRDRVAQLRELDKRREAILKSLKEQEKLTPELEQKVMEAATLTALEDLYLPYRPKRKTRATTAKEKGLAPLAEQLLAQENAGNPEDWAQAFINEEKGVTTIEEALQGARDIIAEQVNEHAEAREEMRRLFIKKGQFKARVIPGKEAEGQKYKDYFEWEEAVEKAPSHRVLAMRRAEKEMILTLECTPEEDEALHTLERRFLQSGGAVGQQITLSIKDGYKRLMKPSIETDVRLATKKRADEEAIRVFSENLRQLLLASPLGQKRVLAVDPGFRTGCKLVCLDAQGKLLQNDTIYPHPPQRQTTESAALIKHLVQQYNIEAVAIGNGTASRETEAFFKQAGLPNSVTIIMVNESGASVYSASEVARNEFPDYDLTVRGAVSIGRRLMDPLAELVKIDPKSIGVGQYQHDVDQSALKQGLDDVVISCVNAVGVEVNSASEQLLTYVSGLGPSLAKNIVQYRNENGPFKNRAALKKVPRLGDKAFEQAAGFLRIQNAANPLDASAVHPERYTLVQQMAKDLSCQVEDLMQKDALRKQIDLKRYQNEEVGLPTLNDIMAELAKPGRDPRQAFEAFAFQDGVDKISDLTVGMKLPGLVTNITNFGAFVDIGVHQDGLIHISHLADRFVSDPNEVVKVQQQVMVTVLEVDEPRKRISLSMKADPFATPAPKKRNEGGRGNAGGRRQGGGNSGRNYGRNQDAPQGDLQDKLQALKNKFGK